VDREKQTLLEDLRSHIVYIQGKINESTAEVTVRNSKGAKEASSLRREDQVVFWNIKAQLEKRLEELAELYKVPYFVKCELKYEGTSESVIYRFAKFQFTDEAIYSWVAPISSVRFEQPGKVSYTVPSGEVKTATLIAKEQYMIVNGNVIFFTKETIESPRELIYQEHFSTRKSGFILPEIVAEMEKAQDQVIRAHYKGPLVISGPAGSGKTTLAFHRIAYLVQAPDTAALYPSRSIAIFVQDNGTKEYFSHLLPELGIKNVMITTFSEWAFTILGIKDSYRQVTKYTSRVEEDDDLYEYEKLKIVRSGIPLEFNARPFMMLDSVFSKHLSETSYKLFLKQKKEKVLDRIDLTLLLKAYLQKRGAFKVPKSKEEILYPLILVDEFQNYLPEQLKLLKGCLDTKTNSMLYVGDLAQQINLGTIRSWRDIDEDILEERSILLKKVYRNTKNILEYINGLGYSVSIPEGIREGIDVKEEILANAEEEILYIKNLIKTDTDRTIGVIAKDGWYLQKFQSEFGENKNVHILTMSQSQGVEFDVVCIVGITKDTFTINHTNDLSEEHLEERFRIQKDLLYVALTRAISELHVLGTQKLTRGNPSS
jgi:DNA helicase IV